jgi:hypothetical protein
VHCAVPCGWSCGAAAVADVAYVAGHGLVGAHGLAGPARQVSLGQSARGSGAAVVEVGCRSCRIPSAAAAAEGAGPAAAGAVSPRACHRLGSLTSPGFALRRIARPAVTSPGWPAAAAPLSLKWAAAVVESPRLRRRLKGRGRRRRGRYRHAHVTVLGRSHSPAGRASRRSASLGQALHRPFGARVARPASPGFASRRIARPGVTSSGLVARCRLASSPRVGFFAPRARCCCCLSPSLAWG